jgi:oligopeptide/dipeptide ABC transporter ATP-binding protein
MAQAEETTRGASALRRTLRSPLGLIVVALLVLLAGVVIVAPFVLRTQADRMDVDAMQQGMSLKHLFGTDELGRDIFARTLVAARLSVLLALATAACASVFGVVLGLAPVVAGRRAGRLIVATVNLFVAFPGLLIALFLAMIFGVGAQGAVLALALALTPGLARLTHTTASAVAGADYVSAARLLGVSRTRIVLRHVLPNIAGPLVVAATTVVGTALLALSALSYLGFGVQAPSYDWGQMLNEGLSNIYTDPAAALLPGAAIVLTGAAFILAGEAAAQIAAGRFGTPHPGRRKAQVVAEVLSAADVVDSGVDEHGGTADADADLVLRAENLTVSFPALATTPVRGVSLAVHAGEIVGIVGESGSGKSLTAAALGRLVPHPGTAEATRLELSGRDLRTLPRGERDRLLGRSLATVFQNPMSAMNPSVRVGLQLAEVSQVHQNLPRRQALARAAEHLAAVGIGAAARRARQYPGQFSGGMRQRAMIAMGLMAEPSLIIADEPTTALDASVQREILALLRAAADDRGMAVLFISHDIALVSEIASRVLVMYAGQVVEELPVASLAGGSAHPYTRALVASVPDMRADRTLPLVTIEGRPPEPGAWPAGCAFADRCPFADERCRTHRPPLAEVGAVRGRRVACWKPQAEADGGVLESDGDRIGGVR